MARGVARSGSGRPVQQNGDPPQSTAAQLVNHFTDGKKHSKIKDQETFRLLLREVLGTDNEQISHPNAFETDSNVNFKLIYVIVKAGLDVLTPDDPFGRSRELRLQAIESLSAIEHTIGRNPEVLFVTSPSQKGDPKPHGPLYIWLVPKVLALISHPSDENVTNGVTKVLEAALVAERKTHIRKAGKSSVMRYIQGCVKDVLHYIEESITTSPTQIVNLPLAGFPSNATIAEVCLDDLQATVQQSVLQTPLRSIAQASSVTICLLSVVVTMLAVQGKSISTLPDETWALNALVRFWRALALEGANFGHGQLSPSCLITFLDMSRKLLGRMAHTKASSAIVSRSAFLLSQLTATLLGLETLPLAASVERMLCLILLGFAFAAQRSQPLRRIFIEQILLCIATLIEDQDRLNGFGQDLQDAISLIVHLKDENLLSGPSPLPQAQMPSFKDSEVDLLCRNYFSSSVSDSASEAERPRKRVRLSIVKEGSKELDARSLVVKTIKDLLGLQENSELVGLSQTAINCYPTLSEEQRCLLYASIGQLICTSVGAFCEASRGKNGSLLSKKCYICDIEPRETLKDRDPLATWDDPEAEGIFAAIASLIKLPETQKFRRPRVAAMLALKRLLSHTANMNHLDLTSSPFGQWCLQALHSSIRELRVAAGRTLPAFLQSHLPAALLVKNRLVAIDVLRHMSGQNDLALQETSILAWGQIARVSCGDHMNLILLKLVEYLGHTNALICGLAYDEIQQISNHSPFSAMKLFAPYWRTIAVTVVQDLQRKPQVAQQMSDLLAMSVSDFLSMTQVHTVPFFVLTKKQDILQRIADASGQSIMALCREHNNLAAILSCVLLQSSSDVESMVMNLLHAVSPEYSNVDCAELLKSEPQATAAELLRAAGEDNDLKKSKAHQALHYLASVTHGKGISGRGSARKMDVIGSFFESHVLGIMALLADIINDGKGPQPVLEKMRCLGAIREMIKLAKNYVSNGLPQICACLRSAIENKELSNEGLGAWLVMMNTLGEDEIAALVDPTFAILVQHWRLFGSGIQGQAYDMIDHLMKTHSTMICDIVHTLPSLSSIPLMAKFEGQLDALKSRMDVKHHFIAFSQRCQNENATVAVTALRELAEYLTEHQGFLHEAANSEQPDTVVSQLIRSILDTSVLFSSTNLEISVLCAKCLGLVGCLDPTRIEATREKREILVLSNFVRNDETNDFVIFFLREVLVKAFLSATNSRSQGFLAYAMQELLSISAIREAVISRSRDGPHDANYRRWVSLPESVRTTLMPFTDSKYFVTAGVSQPPCTYPLYSGEMSHGHWLRAITFDLLKRKLGTGKVQTIFSVLSRIVRFQDISISNFLLPFACLNVIVNGEDHDRREIGRELLQILLHSLPDQAPRRDNVILCSQTVFQVLDYLSRWMQEKKKELANCRTPGTRTGRSLSQADAERDILQISSVESVLAIIPADVISRRAVECKSYSRALFHWEQYIRQQRERCQANLQEGNLEPLYERLQEIYTQIDEPDGIEGISTHLQVLNIDQQILEHRKAGRWTAAQSWYELLLNERPNDLEVQCNLLTSLKESGQHDVLLNQIDGFQHSHASEALSLPFAVEASWVTGKLSKLRDCLALATENSEGDFNVGIGRALLALSEDRLVQFSSILENLRQITAKGLSMTNTASLQDCHEALLRFHVLTEIETISGVRDGNIADKRSPTASMNQRLDVLGPFLSDKQYILGLRRATMQLSKRNFSEVDVASAWITSAKLARKGNFIHQAFNAVLHASQLGDESARIEHSRLLWREGNRRKAIQSLEGAISANAFRSYDYTETEESITTNNPSKQQQQNSLKASAHLLLAKWIDRAGQTQFEVVTQQYKKAIEFHIRWEKAHYCVGKHYNKLLESEKAKPPAKQAQTFISGEIAKLIIENYLRSLAYGAKYIYQTLPKLLTLWLDLGSETEKPLDPKYGNNREFMSFVPGQQKKMLEFCNLQMKKYVDRCPAFVWYTAFSQIVARICHPNQAVYKILVEIVAKVVSTHAPQALWTLLAVVKSSSKDRASRGATCMHRVMDHAKKLRGDSIGLELKALIAHGQKLSDQLLHACEGDIHGKPANISLSKDLGFNHKIAPSKMAIPLEMSLTASLPTGTENVNMRQHKPFSNRDCVTISSFLDDALVLNSLQRPRKINIRGSDGHVYALLCKPKDDLRKDQRLMEFNAMINRALKKDAESSKRRLYIKTYAVTPLNEECGLIEWIDNLKTLREILLASYKQKNVAINYGELRQLLTDSISAPNKLSIFTQKIIPHFPPVFHEWFVEMFPEPGAWFTARLRYTRSCAVMSIVGHVLGLGDRHGENILFEEGNGGTFHVDFNCLFDKGLTFEKPELVPFRLTHNMIDAFGAYGYEGPFRKSCELTLGILRQNEDTLMTILETFLYDPTTDFIGTKKKTVNIVPDTPEGVLESVRNKVRGLLPMESVPLSVEGYVQALILQATDPFKLASMYIGWCAFF